MTACTYAQIEIENKLKSPSSAEHQACRYNTYTSLGNDKYVVESYVDAENAYGATVRTDYKCTVTLTGSDVYYINCSIL
ncbi:hypothetical protein M0P48_02340 [Candidatus Gracilibacteria bacterium]|nr:hypothetical protein [Candidatus Gracilibacteria bacterium]